MAVAVIEEMPGAVAAEIVIAAELALAVADDEDAPARDLHREIVAGAGQQRDRADELPLAGEDLAPFALEDLWPVIPAGGKGELRLRLDRIIHAPDIPTPAAICQGPLTSHRHPGESRGPGQPASSCNPGSLPGL